MTNKFWKKKRDPVNINELMEKMAGDSPDYFYYGFLEKFTMGKPQLKQELIKKDYFTHIGKNQQGQDCYILGQTGMQWVNAKKMVESSENMEIMTRWLVLFTIILSIIGIIQVILLIIK